MLFERGIMVANNCVKCGNVITDSEYKYAKEHYGSSLCKKCQKGKEEIELVSTAIESPPSEPKVHDVFIEVPFRTRMLGYVITVLSLVGLFRGFLKFVTEPPQTYALYFFQTDWVSIFHILSQILFFSSLVFSFYLIFKKQQEPKVIWGG